MTDKAREVVSKYKFQPFLYSVFSFVVILMVEILRVEAKKNPQRRGGNGFMDGVARC